MSTLSERRQELVRRALARRGRGKGGARTQTRIEGALSAARRDESLPSFGRLPDQVARTRARSAGKAPSGAVMGQRSPHSSVPTGIYPAGKDRDTTRDVLIRRRRRRRRQTGEILEG